MTSELAWYDRILIFLPDLYRPRIFTVVALVVLCFWGVKLNWALDWDVVLTSYFFLGPCSVLTFLTATWCFYARKFGFRHQYMLIDLVLLGIALVVGYLAVKDSYYIYQGEYKFLHQWGQVQDQPELLIPLPDDTRKYSGKSLWQTSIEPIASNPSPNIEVAILMGGEKCHILQSDPEFAWTGPLTPVAKQTRGQGWKESNEHTWELHKMKKHMRVVFSVGIGLEEMGSSEAGTPEAFCLPYVRVMEEVKEE